MGQVSKLPTAEPQTFGCFSRLLVLDFCAGCRKDNPCTLHPEGTAWLENRGDHERIWRGAGTGERDAISDRGSALIAHEILEHSGAVEIRKMKSIV